MFRLGMLRLGVFRIVVIEAFAQTGLRALGGRRYGSLDLGFGDRLHRFRDRRLGLLGRGYRRLDDVDDRTEIHKCHNKPVLPLFSLSAESART
jgi:hypothetical protein